MSSVDLEQLCYRYSGVCHAGGLEEGFVQVNDRWYWKGFEIPQVRELEGLAVVGV